MGEKVQTEHPGPSRFDIQFFINSYSGHLPNDCNRMKRLLSLDTVVPEFERQLNLF